MTARRSPLQPTPPTARWAPPWVADAVFYQVFPDRFRNGDPSIDPPDVVPWETPPDRHRFHGGDLQGLIDALPYVQDLGCTALYLNPIFRAETNHRYDTADYYAIDPRLGDERTFDRLVAAAHRAGIRLVLDGVFNHCGLGFAPFQDVVRNGAASRYRTWFDIYDFPVRVADPANYATCGGASYLPRLNAHDPEVEAFVHDVALHWLGRGIDGWRLDVPYEIHTDFWRRFRRVVKRRHPAAYLVAEEWRDASPFLQGDTFDGATHYELRRLILDFVATRALTGEAFLRALETLVRRLPAGAGASMLTLLGSHDTERALHACGGDVARLEVAFTCLFTMPGAPLVYYGDEIGMTGGNDPACRAAFPWDEARWNASLRDHVRRLIALRKGRESLRRGSIRGIYGNDRVAVYERFVEGERTVVCLDAGDRSRRMELPIGAADLVVSSSCSGERLVVRESPSG